MFAKARELNIRDIDLTTAAGVAANAAWKLREEGKTAAMAVRFRNVLVARGCLIPPVPVGVDDWAPPEADDVQDEATRAPRDEDSEDEKVRRNMIRFRQMLGFDQVQASDHVGIPYETLVAWERGDRTPSGTELLRIAPRYGRRAEEFIRVGDVAPPDRSLIPRAIVRLNEDVADEDRRSIQEIVDRINDPAYRAEHRAMTEHVLKARKRDRQP